METKKNKLSKLIAGAYKYSLILEMILIFCVFAILTNGMFLSTRNLSNLLMQGATCSIIAITMMLVIVSCNCDLSAGAALGFLGAVAASLQVNAKLGPVATILIVLLLGIAIGLFNAFWIAHLELPAFLVTLGGQLIFKGLVLAVSNGRTIGPVDEVFAKIGGGYLPKINQSLPFNDTSLYITVAIIVVYIFVTVSSGKKKAKYSENTKQNKKNNLFRLIAIPVVILVVASIMIFHQGFPYAIIVLLVLAAIFHFICKNTVFGRHVFAIGGNVEAARLSGVSIKKQVTMIYVLHGLVIAVASIVFLGRVGQATATAGTGFEFTAITGCVVGGTSIAGGFGNIPGAIIGTMLMGGIDNGMSVLNIGATGQYIVKGIVLLLAITMDVMSKKKKA